MSTFQQSVQTGYQYMQLWPVERQELAIRFHDVRAIRLNRHAMRHMPWLAMLTVVLAYGYGHPEMLPHMIAAAMLMASLPVQGLLWLGKRAQTALEPHDRRWYRELINQLQQQGVETPSREDDARQLTYWDLAKLVDFAFRKAERAFKLS